MKIQEAISENETAVGLLLTWCNSFSRVSVFFFV